MNASAVIVGIDEAGRGAVAGPVVAGACVLRPELTEHPLIRDSKTLSPEQRTQAYEWITTHCTFGIGATSAEDIDQYGILIATERAMQRAVTQVAEALEPTYLLVDGRDAFWFDYPHSSIVKGDTKEPCIAAASILAKVYRDTLMKSHCAEFPGYAFCRHKGYGTADHFHAIQRSGVLNIHRKTFLKNAI